MKVGWKTIMKQQKLVEKMTIEEKAAILSGKTVWQTREIDRLSIPSIFLSDGPHGIRKQAGAGDHLGLNASLNATCFPTAATIANSWNQDLGEEIGQALGEEAASMDVNILLGPGLNIKRSPLCGRNFEYFSEDPYLSGKMAASYIRGIQSKGVYACPKHLAVNSQELRRMAMDAVVDERTLREIYLTGFEIAVKEVHAKAIMSSYNQINGIYANEDKHLLTDILRKDWGFDGIVVTDWGGSNDHVKGVAAGSNLEMPSCGYDSAREVIAAVRNGKLKETDLDERVGELVDAVMELTSGKKLSDKNFDRDAHHQLARKAAAESMILLKNEKQILPLDTKKSIAVIGDFAFSPRYQGAGSSMVNPTKVEDMSSILQQYDLNILGMTRGYQRNGDVISDMESRMYAYPQEIIDYLENDPKKPYLLCEYMHDMGNSLGGMNSYMDLLDRFEMYQGGFIWDYIDQALWVKDEVTGRRVLRYGGDFDDRPSDYEFSGNGILFADRSEKPAMQEGRYYYGT